MKKIIYLLGVLLSLSNVQPVYSHDTYSPFLFINQQLVSHNPITTKSVENFELTHEVAPENYLVLQPVDFRIDTFKVDKPAEWIKEATFIFDFGDGKSAKGLQVLHTYEKIGTYSVSVLGQNKEDAPQLLSHVLVQITTA